MSADLLFVTARCLRPCGKEWIGLMRGKWRISVSTAPDRGDDSVLTMYLIGSVVFTAHSFDTDPALPFDAACLACSYWFSPKRSP